MGRQQFPTIPAADSRDAFRIMMETVTRVKDYRCFCWATEWMLQATKEHIIAAEERALREERFGHDRDAAETRAFLERYYEIYPLVNSTERSVDEMFGTVKPFPFVTHSFAVVSTRDGRLAVQIHPDRDTAQRSAVRVALSSQPHLCEVEVIDSLTEKGTFGNGTWSVSIVSLTPSADQG